MKIYTRTGDEGETSLFGGKRVGKDVPRIEAYGTVDELNSVIGIARSFNKNRKIDKLLGMIQNQLFVLGADLATPSDVTSTAVHRIGENEVRLLEETIDELDVKLEPLKTFILPGGSKTSAILHFSRTVCRRAERKVAPLKGNGEVSRETLVYLNRLSDLLFVLARFANKSDEVKEIPWNPRRDSGRNK
ncbi:MAG TPA: cob(I)yrinic acid a,c-diamide adenosyltransferase [Candidatus Kryptonia bacterium]